MLADAGVNLILLKMLKDIPQTQAALRVASEMGLLVWAGFSCRVDDAGVVRVLEGEPGGGLPTTFDEALAAFGESHVDAALIMHIAIEDVTPALAVLASRWSGPTGAYPHEGKWVKPGWAFNEAMRPALLTAEAIKYLCTLCTGIWRVLRPRTGLHRRSEHGDSLG